MCNNQEQRRGELVQGEMKTEIGKMSWRRIFEVEVKNKWVGLSEVVTACGKE